MGAVRIQAGGSAIAREPCWGAEYPAELRNGEWEYQVFESDGKPRANAKHEACFTCHKPKSGQDFVFSYPQLLEAAR
jgi:hypothetical protein